MGCGCGRGAEIVTTSVQPAENEEGDWGIPVYYAGKYPDIWINILDYLNMKELARVSLTCSFLYELAGDTRVLQKFKGISHKKLPSMPSLSHKSSHLEIRPSRDVYIFAHSVVLAKVEEAPNHAEGFFDIISDQKLKTREPKGSLFAKRLDTDPVNSHEGVESTKNVGVVLGPESPSSQQRVAVVGTHTPRFVTPKGTLTNRKSIFRPVTETAPPIALDSKRNSHTPSVVTSIDNPYFRTVLVHK